jgi:hypothetical protein
MVEREGRQASGRRAWLMAASAAASVALLLIGQAILLSDTHERRIFPERVLNGDLALISLRGGVDLMAANGFTHPWLTPADLARACHERCVTRDLAWTEDGSALELVLETTSKSAGLYAVSAGSHDVRFLAGCPDGTCASEGWDAMQEGATTFGPDQAPAAMAPDGSPIAYVAATRRPDGAMSAELWTVTADGTDAILLHDFGCCFLEWSPPVWAPDGKQVAIYLHVHDGSLETNRVSILEFPSGARLRQINGLAPLSWQRRSPEE